MEKMAKAHCVDNSTIFCPEKCPAGSQPLLSRVRGIGLKTWDQSTARSSLFTCWFPCAAAVLEMTFISHFHALEKEMETHSSVLAWRMPGTAEPGGLPSVGSHRVGHNCSDLAAAAGIVGGRVLDSFLPETKRQRQKLG